MRSGRNGAPARCRVSRDARGRATRAIAEAVAVERGRPTSSRRTPPGATSAGLVTPVSSTTTWPIPAAANKVATCAPTRPAPRTWIRAWRRARSIRWTWVGSVEPKEIDARSGTSRSWSNIDSGERSAGAASSIMPVSSNRTTSSRRAASRELSTCSRDRVPSSMSSTEASRAVSPPRTIARTGSTPICRVDPSRQSRRRPGLRMGRTASSSAEGD